MADRDTGIVLIVVGAVLMAVGILFFPVCAIGLILLVVGIVIVATSPTAPAAYYPPYPMPPSAAGGPLAPTPACPVCGSSLTWVPPYGRWYCYRCQSYR